MEEVVKVIERAVEKDIIDYLLVIVPIIISVVAIIISIATAKKQNKIAMFERRYTCLFQIKLILNFADSIKENTSKNVVMGLYDAFWGSNISNLSGNRQAIEAKCSLETVMKDVEQAIFLFNHKFEVSPIELLKSFHNVIFATISEADIDVLKKDFISMCERFTEKDFKKLQKSVKL